MASVDALKDAFRTDPTPSRRERRAMATRAQALSPARILTQVLLVPVVTIAVTVSIYTRTSPYERSDALRHLVAMAGCDTARSVGLAPAFRGAIGYHKRNDPDGDGIACAPARSPAETVAAWEGYPYDAGPGPAQDDGDRMQRGAKFLRP